MQYQIIKYIPNYKIYIQIMNIYEYTSHDVYKHTHYISQNIHIIPNTHHMLYIPMFPLNGLLPLNSRIDRAQIRRSNMRLDFKRTFKTVNLLFFLYYIGICALNNIYSFLCFPHRVLVSITGDGDNCHIELRNFGFRPTGVAAR